MDRLCLTFRRSLFYSVPFLQSTNYEVLRFCLCATRVRNHLGLGRHPEPVPCRRFNDGQPQVYQKLDGLAIVLLINFDLRTSEGIQGWGVYAPQYFGNITIVNRAVSGRSYVNATCLSNAS